MTDFIDISKKVFEADDIQKLLGLGRTKTYEFLDEVFQKAGAVPCHQDWKGIQNSLSPI